jgi:alcohol dehydrogenase (NADP+)
LNELGLDYVDLFLVHWPMGNSTGRNSMDYRTASLSIFSKSQLTTAKVWKGMEALVNKGTRFIGISNHSPAQLQDVLSIATVKPKAHQLEIHPYLPQTSYVQTTLRAGIKVIGYTPLGNTNKVYGAVTRRATPLLANPVLTAIARERGCASAAQVSVAWSIKSGVVPIPKAAMAAHQKENLAAVAQCKLTDGDAQKIANIGVRLRMNGALCMTFNNVCWAGLEG